MPDKAAVRPDKDNRQSSVAEVSVVEAADIGVELADRPADIVQAVVAVAADRPVVDRAEQVPIQVALADAAMRKHMNIPA